MFVVFFCFFWLVSVVGAPISLFFFCCLLFPKEQRCVCEVGVFIFLFFFVFFFSFFFSSSCPVRLQGGGLLTLQGSETPDCPGTLELGRNIPSRWHGQQPRENHGENVQQHPELQPKAATTPMTHATQQRADVHQPQTMATPPMSAPPTGSVIPAVILCRLQVPPHLGQPAGTFTTPKARSRAQACFSEPAPAGSRTLLKPSICSSCRLHAPSRL